MSQILCTICARGGSKGVKNKNIKEINGKPLIAYTIEQALKSKLFTHIVVSTDCDNIADVAKQFGAEVFFKRPEELANDTAGKIPVIQHACQKSESYYKTQFDYIIDLDATAPIRQITDIINSYQYFLDNNFDNLITAVNARKSPYFNQIELYENNKIALSKTPKHQILRRQDAPKTYDMNASIYIWKRKVLLKTKPLIDERTGLYVMDEASTFDVDTPIDFKIVEMLIKELNV